MSLALRSAAQQWPEPDADLAPLDPRRLGLIRWAGEQTVPYLTVDGITARDAAILTSNCERWRQLAFSVERIEPSKLTTSVSAVYRELSLAEPEEFLFFDSPQAALNAYSSWKARTGKVASVLWNYQLPLFDPGAYWRRWSRWPDLDLAIKRKPNAHRCYASGEALTCDGSVLSSAAHKQIWDGVLQHLSGTDWCTNLVEELEEHQAMEALDVRLSAEDPTSQAWPMDFFILGPRLWLLREVAALEFASSTLACRTNRPLLDALVGTLLSGSLLITFERLVIAVDRPIAFDGAKPRF